MKAPVSGLALAALMLAAASSKVWAAPDVTFDYTSKFGQFGFLQFPPNGFGRATGVAFYTADELLIADYGNSWLQRCDIDGANCEWFGGFAARRNTPGVFDRPHGVAVREDGMLAVADEDNHAVQLCELRRFCLYSGDQITEDNKPSTALGRWAFPNDVDFNAEGQVFGLDTGNNRIQILSADDLRVRRVFMSGGSGLGQLDGARGLAVAADGTVVISDTGNHRIQLCDTGRPVNCTAFGRRGSGPGQFESPVGIEVDHLDRIWVADTGNNRLQVCDREGSCTVLNSGSDYEFNAPHDVAVHPSGKVAVANTEDSQILVFRTDAQAPQPALVNAGFNDAWFNPDTAGQGVFINVFAELGQVFVAWFTFDAERPTADAPALLGEAGHRWLTALGPIDGNRAVLQVALTEGGLFDTRPPVPTVTGEYGTLELEFVDCETVLMRYELPVLEAAEGTVTLSRVIDDNVALCEALKAP
ncbi:MAG: hypothetical protein HRU51_03155 [Xanthomonadales bacterium]|nr:hypothetical protein [Xanthomonadales bacterium]